MMSYDMEWNDELQAYIYVPMLGPVLFDFCANLNCGKFMNVSR